MNPRAATAADAWPIRRLIYRTGINPSGLKWERFLVIDSPEGALIACGQIKPHADGTRELASIAVRPEWRGRGLARRIIEGLLERETGEVFLMCRSSNAPLYEKFQFGEAALADLPRYFQRVFRFAGRMNLLIAEGERLMIMRRQPNKNL